MADDTEHEEAPHNPGLEKFLATWDRNLSEENRVFGIKLLFAGCESKRVRDGLYRIGVRHIQVSYYYLRRWLQKATLQEIAEDLGRFDFVLLESGGYTLTQAIEKESKLDVSLKEYAEEYYAFLPKVRDVFAACSELDVEELGDAYREEKKQEMIQQGVPIIPVIQGRDLEYYESCGWFEDYPLIAIGSAIVDDAPYLNQVFEMGKKKGIVFHGFGATSAKTILRSRFYSVGSSSWNHGSRYGTTMVFQNGRIRHYDKENKKIRTRYKGRFEDFGLVWEDIEADKALEIDMMNALAWKQWSDYTRYSAARCYWLAPEELDQALTLKSKAFNAEGLVNRTTSIERAGVRRLAVYADAREADDRAQETLQCDTCHIASRCPRFKPKQPCGFDVNVRLETKSDLRIAMQLVVESQYNRVMTGVLFEKLEGGVIDGRVTAEMTNLFNMIEKSRKIFEAPQDELTIKMKAPAGGIAAGLASVFAKNGSGNGSGNTQTERAANHSPPHELPEAEEEIPFIESDGEAVEEATETASGT